VVNSVGSAFWNDNCYESGTSHKLFRFLFYIRQLLRHSLGVCLITVKNDLIKDAQFLAKISNLSDYVFVIDSLVNGKNHLDKSQYDGLFHIVKLARLNTINSFLPETLDLAFSVKRKRFVVEILALPPDITEDGDEKKGRTSSTTSLMSCSSGGGGKLDF
jgi:elongator complex protein 4